MCADHASSYYLTTPIFYVNAAPHLGSAYCTIASDALARAMRMDGRDAWFLTGLDEHGQKIAQAAADQGMSPQDWVDAIAPAFIDAWAALNVTNDDFIRTTEERHIKAVQRFFDLLREKGAIYQDTYRGYYCVPDETFFTDEQLSEFADARRSEGLPAATDDGSPLCPDCSRALVFVEEDNLFFRLSDYAPALLKLYEDNPGFVQPEIRRNEVISFVRSGLKDLSVSRTTFDWGVPLPFAPGHVSYVWVDALINYLTAVGFGSDDPDDIAELAYRWPAQVHLVGKDIIRFHAVIWPALLMAVGLPLPEKVFAHGFLMVDGQKMSKSRGNVIHPLEISADFTVDGYRYFFLSDIQFGADASFSVARILQVYNADLANSWGNLCSRVLNMTERYLGGRVPDVWPKTIAALTAEMGNPLAEVASGIYAAYIPAMEDLDYTSAMSAVMALVDRANLYLEESAPWSLARAAEAELEAANAAGASLDDANAPTAADRLAFVLLNCLEAMRIAALFFAPVMPESSAEVWRRLGLDDVNAVTDLSGQAAWGSLPAGNQVTVGDPLFPRLAIEDINLANR
jgi:methionyl-tRNA synthetase